MADKKSGGRPAQPGTGKNSARADRVAASNKAGRPKLLNTLIVVATAIAIAAGTYFGWFSRRGEVSLTPAPNVASSTSASYVGSASCKGCHEDAYKEWQASQHQKAMQQANDGAVLGDFTNSKFTYSGITSTFFKRENRYYVRTGGRDGKLADFEIKYTFGVYPLQQYLIEFPDGRLQALSIAWDARLKSTGGQRWFHLYPNERITHDDELHWTRPAQNWNFMCADCHSTNVRKNYDAGADRFQTQWSEISVGCEACHGPGSRHLAWSKAKSEAWLGAEDLTKGLTARLDERRGILWNVNATTGNAVRSQARASEREIDVCAQCHARRGQLAEGYQAGKHFVDYYYPALLTSPLYHSDGQQQGEVYNWGSFLQSKMYAHGVTCSDCHNPHSGKLRAEGNAVCATCHVQTKYDSRAHHHHRPASAGAACVACHMPSTTYMVVDPRADHSLRIPRPDLSLKFGAPNACNGCHKNRDVRWAAAQVNSWYGRDPQGHQGFAAAFYAADTGALDAQAQLRALVGDATQPAIVRATGLAELNGAPSRQAQNTLANGLRDANPIVRLGALQSIARGSKNDRLTLVAPVLSDPVRTVRIEAASILASVPVAQMSTEQRAAFEHAAGEYIDAQRYNADRAEARVNLGTFYANRGDVAKAEDEIKAAIRLDPFFIPAYVNLADIYRGHDRDADGEKILREGTRIAPNSAILHHALGLALVRLKRTEDGLSELERATVLDPGNARFAYVYAVALHSTGKSGAAIARLKKTLVAHPNDRDILEALVGFHSARRESAAAEKYAEQLRTLTEK